MTSQRSVGVRPLTIPAIAILLSIMASRSVAQEPVLSIKVDAPLVTVDARVVDGSGRPVTNLTQNDFRIYEDGKEQDVQSFFSANSAFNILVLYDGVPGGAVSVGPQSMQETILSTITHFLGVLRVQDRFSVAEISAQDVPSVKVPWQLVQPQMQATFRISSAEKLPYYKDLYGRNVYSALVWAARQFRGIDGRKAIIVFSNGVDRSATPTTKENRNLRALMLDPLFGLPDAIEESAFQSALLAVQQSGVPFYFVATGPSYIEKLSKNDLFGETGGIACSQIHVLTGDWKRCKDLLARVHTRLEQAANATGGRAYFPRAVEDVQAQAEQISEDLKTFYSLAYHPPKSGGDGATHRIEIRVRDKSLRVIQSRTEYTAN